jgi:uncharacterized protein (UPF0335 family)
VELGAFPSGHSERRKRGGPLNKRLRSLIQKLGEAIHETVSESEDIASVVQDIRKQGFDVLLMLEATIGLNEVEQQPKQLMANAGSNGDAEDGEVDSATGFTNQDLNFLRSLRIAVEGDTAGSPVDSGSK